MCQTNRIAIQYNTIQYNTIQYNFINPTRGNLFEQLVVHKDTVTYNNTHTHNYRAFSCRVAGGDELAFVSRCNKEKMVQFGKIK